MAGSISSNTPFIRTSSSTSLEAPKKQESSAPIEKSSGSQRSSFVDSGIPSPPPAPPLPEKMKLEQQISDAPPKQVKTLSEEIQDFKARPRGLQEQLETGFTKVGHKIKDLQRMKAEKREYLKEKSILSPKDQQLLSTTTHQVKPFLGLSSLTSLSNGLGKLEQKLTGLISFGPMAASRKQAVLNEIKNTMVKKVKNLPPNSDLAFQINTKSKDELKFEAIKMVMELKPKYKEMFHHAMGQLEEGQTKFKQDLKKHQEMSSLILALQSKEPPVGQAKIDVENRIVDLMRELNFEPKYIKVKENGIETGELRLNLNLKPPTPKEPKLNLDQMYSMLSSKKQEMVNVLVDGMLEGIAQSSTRINTNPEVGGTIPLRDVPGYQAKAMGADVTSPVPKSFFLNGTQYDLQGILGEGGGGVVMTYKNAEGHEVVLKKDFEDLRPEASVHRHLHSENSIGYLGALRLDYDGKATDGSGKIVPKQEVLVIMEKAQTDLTHAKTDLMTKGTKEEQMTALKSLSLDIIRGLKDAHNDNVGHGDMKLDNVYISKDGKAKIADFGQSNLSDDQKTHKFFGTPSNNAPEVLENLKESDYLKNDIWCTGLVLYEMYTGSASPFTRPTDTDSLQAQNRVKAFGKDPNNRIFDTPQNEIEKLINAMMHPDPSKRPSFESIEKLSLFDSVRDGSGRGVVNSLIA